MNHVTIGHFVCDENGHAKGGKPGDQTGREGRFQSWYLEGSNGSIWQDVFRAKGKKIRKKIAKNMIELVENPHIGYNQNARTTLDREAKKVDYDFKKIEVDCDTDCSQATAECIIGAGIPISPDMYTGNEKQLIEATGQFKTYDGASYTKSDQKLKVGDILFKIGHSAIVVKVQYIIDRYIKYQEGQPIMSGEDIEKIQKKLNKVMKCKLEVDGEYGPKTAAETVRFQSKKKLTPDGIIGPKTAEALGFWWEG